MRPALLTACLLAPAAAVALVLYAQAKELTFTIDDLEAPAFSAHAVRASMSGAGFRELAVDIDRVVVGARSWRKVKIACPEFELATSRISCTRGVLDIGEKIPLSFSYSPQARDLTLEAKPASDETWSVSGRFAGPQTALQVKLARARIEPFASWLPDGTPKISSGRASGTLTMQGGTITANLNIDGLNFADASGLHAGEKIAATVEANVTEKSGEWRWKTRVAWGSGEAFWQPFYLKGRGQRFSIEAVTTKAGTDVGDGQLDLPGVGTVAFTGRWDNAAGAFSALQAQTTGLRVGPLYEELLKPLLHDDNLSDARVEGSVTASVKLGREGVTEADLDLSGISFEDRERRFGVFGLSGRVPWRRDAATTGEITLKGAEFLQLPIGAVKAPLRLRGFRIAIDAVKVPILDGALSLRDFVAARTEQGWRWRFAGDLTAISMVQLTQTLRMPVMHGSLSGEIPEVRYRRQTLAMDGALLIRVFDGTVSASNLQLLEPFSRAPRLHAEVEMKNLDLELLTRAFDFGTITGRIDAHVRGLELANWRPARFDARIASSDGTYPRKISQRAVQNISALGGAGAAAAIQRSILRFFDQFGYDRLGLSCRYENNVCEMDGIEQAPQGYVIVKGGGIPAISVIGYNRHVSGTELVDRLKRITQKNVKPIVN